jgi:hypothetical protein
MYRAVIQPVQNHVKLGLCLSLTEEQTECKTSSSYCGEYEDNCLLGHCLVASKI